MSGAPTLDHQSPTIQLIETRASEECGCPEEFYHFRSIELTMHIEPDGSVHAFMDAGDWEAESSFPAQTLEQARPAVFAWAERTVMGDQA